MPDDPQSIDVRICPKCGRRSTTYVDHLSTCSRCPCVGTPDQEDCPHA